jgi:hypothetical protein|nr:MAG TPA: hypothetical protein [Caudoviricetes sp.]
MVIWISLIVMFLFVLIVISLSIVLTLFLIGVILEAIKTFNEMYRDTIQVLKNKLRKPFKTTIDKSQDL